MKPAYFDLSVRDPEAARRFFETVLGWRFERFPMPYPYWRVTGGAEAEPGIDGGLGALADAPLAEGRPLTVLTMPVDDLDAVLAQVVEAGGRIVEPAFAIGGVGRYASCAEPGGLVFGLVEPERSAA